MLFRDKAILIVDDSTLNRQILSKLLAGEYELLEASDGVAALSLLHERRGDILCVILDLQMPVMDGRELLRRMQAENLSAVPTLVTTASDDLQTEQECLQLGAWDFVRKPYDAAILQLRLQSIIARSQLKALEQVQYLSEHDPLTGLYNRAKFFSATREMLSAHPKTEFVFVRIDIDRFRLINSFFGEKRGDELLCYLADLLRHEVSKEPFVTYGRMEADVFCVCGVHDKIRLLTAIEKLKTALAGYLPSYYVEASFGIRVIDDSRIPIETLYTQASLAARQCKDRYMVSYAYYTASLSVDLVQEQEVMNEAQAALDGGQFVPYFQPKYNLRTGMPYGAEALVRWLHPVKGVVAPGRFIPVFEKNGFVAKLDFFIWDATCRLLKKWKEEGLSPAPVSVNISRVNMYNLHLPDILYALVKKYGLPPSLLNLELTESAYMDNPEMMKQTVGILRKRGFIVMIDDFGSGYSSLNTLKDISVDVLKIDMKFLPTGETNGRSERILASVIRMAEWLNLTVIVEGVETEEQKCFLETIGCGYVQGYYFARPMPVQQYETLLRDPHCIQMPASGNFSTPESNALLDAVWSGDAQIEKVFSTILQPAGIYEYSSSGDVDTLKVNHAFLTQFGYGSNLAANSHNRKSPHPLSSIDMRELRGAFARAARDRSSASCDYLRLDADWQAHWIRAKVQYVQSHGDRALLFAVFYDITAERQLKAEVQRYRRLFYGESYLPGSAMLVVDDSDISRSILREIFCGQYQILEAENGAQGLALLKEHTAEIAIVLLDMQMPVMDGREFLAERSRLDSPAADIPVIVISVDQSPDMQLGMLRLGVNDYITKPFLPEIVERRVRNVLEYSDRFRCIMQEYRAKNKAE